MAKRLRIRYNVAIDDLSWPESTITFDGIGRIDTMSFQYTSLCVAYEHIWEGDTTEITTINQSINDGVCPI